MTQMSGVLRPDEAAVFALRGIYEKYGYSRFKMSKFEEYDLYVKNKDFLVSEGVITFMDNDGRARAQAGRHPFHRKELRSGKRAAFQRFIIMKTSIA